VGPRPAWDLYRVLFIAGILEGLKHFGPEELKFPNEARYYVSKINEFHGITPLKPEAVTEDEEVACKPVFQVLKGLADEPK